MVPCNLGADPNSIAATKNLTATDFALTYQDIQNGLRTRVSLNKNRNDPLDCDGECAILEKNRRLAEALGIENANISSAFALPSTPAGSSASLNSALSANSTSCEEWESIHHNPHSNSTQVVGGVVSYSTFLYTQAKKNPNFISSLEETLYQFVIRDTATKYRSLPVMNREARRVVHELAAHYNIDTNAQDPEPVRSVLLTKRKDSLVPLILLSEAAKQVNLSTLGTISGDIWMAAVKTKPNLSSTAPAGPTSEDNKSSSSWDDNEPEQATTTTTAMTAIPVNTNSSVTNSASQETVTTTSTVAPDDWTNYADD